MAGRAGAWSTPPSLLRAALLLLAVPIAAACWAGPAGAQPVVRMLRALPVDSGRVDVAAMVQPDANGAWVVGWTSLGEEPADGLVIRVDRDGAPLWRRHLGGTGLDILFAMAADSSGGAICAGFSAAGGSTDGVVVRLDRAGATIWEKRFGAASGGRLASIRAVSDGWLLAGQIERAGDTEAWVLALDRDGVQTASWTWGGPGVQRAFDVEPAPDGGCFIVGTSAQDGDVDGFVTRLDARGREVWTRRVGGSGSQVAYHLRPHLDASFIVTGYGEAGRAGDSDVRVMRIAADGRVLFERRLGGAAAERGVQSAVFADGSIVVVGYARPAAEAADRPVWRTTLHGLDRRGRTAWSLALGGTGRESGRWIAAHGNELWVAGQEFDGERGPVWVARLEAGE